MQAAWEEAAGAGSLAMWKRKASSLRRERVPMDAAARGWSELWSGRQKAESVRWKSLSPAAWKETVGGAEK